jgi:hypothetical protein
VSAIWLAVVGPPMSTCGVPGLGAGIGPRMPVAVGVGSGVVGTAEVGGGLGVGWADVGTPLGDRAGPPVRDG